MQRLAALPKPPAMPQAEMIRWQGVIIKANVMIANSIMIPKGVRRFSDMIMLKQQAGV